MNSNTTIQWTDATWNPVRGCSRVSEGCRFCYAERTAMRMATTQYAGLVHMTSQGPKWTGKIQVLPKALAEPGTKWGGKPRRIFVNSMSDLFHEDVPLGFIEEVFGVMAHHAQHTFQVLTKRPEVMLDRLARAALEVPTNVWLGVSVENEPTARERISALMLSPPALRWVSYEPALGPVDFMPWLEGPNRLEWIVCGGESGPRSRECDVAWLRGTIAQCRYARVPVFVKQLGRAWIDAQTRRSSAHRIPEWAGGWTFRHDSGTSGEEMSAWAPDLRVREFPGGVPTWLAHGS